MVAHRNNRARPTKRRGKADVLKLKAEMLEIAIELKTSTVRQIYYQMVSRGLIAKTEAEYNGTVVRLLSEMRKERILPFNLIADNTRWMRKPRTFSGLESYLEHGSRAYRRAMWDNQDAYVEVWLEKEALAGVLVDVTDEFDVPLMVTRGYPSLSFLHSAAQSIQAQDKPAFLYYFGDLDPSGVDISRHVHESIVEMVDGDLINFKRVAVTRHQVDAMNLPTRPTKKQDSRAKTFTGESVEVDAIHPEQLRQMARDCIVRHINVDEWNALIRAEEAERESLRVYLGAMRATP